LNSIFNVKKLWKGKLMRRGRYFLVLLFFFLYGCSAGSRYYSSSMLDRKGGESKEWDQSLQDEDFIYEAGNIYIWKSSFYGKKFHGRLTANGETFDMHSLTCAHRELPFGTILRVTNPKNSNSVIVRVNDRGPFIKGRSLDLSQGAALQLDMFEDGVLDLLVEILELPY